MDAIEKQMGKVMRVHREDVQLGLVSKANEEILLAKLASVESEILTSMRDFQYEKITGGSPINGGLGGGGGAGGGPGGGNLVFKVGAYPTHVPAEMREAAQDKKIEAMQRHLEEL